MPQIILHLWVFMCHGRRHNKITGTGNFIAPETGMGLSLAIYKNWYIFHFFSRAL